MPTEVPTEAPTEAPTEPPTGPLTGGAADDLENVAVLDLARAERRGYPEAIYCEGKTADQVRAIAERLRVASADGTTSGTVLFTRAGVEHARAVRDVLPDALHDEMARLLAWPPEPPGPTGGLVAVLCAGTSDLPVALEALLTARYLGRRTELVVDVGVAGLHRVLARRELIEQARAVIVVAGMDGALPSVVAGLTSVARGRRADLGRLRRRVRRPRPAPRDAQRVLTGRGRRQHRQRLRRGPPRRADHSTLSRRATRRRSSPTASGSRPQRLRHGEPARHP